VGRQHLLLELAGRELLGALDLKRVDDGAVGHVAGRGAGAQAKAERHHAFSPSTHARPLLLAPRPAVRRFRSGPAPLRRASGRSRGAGRPRATSLSTTRRPAGSAPGRSTTRAPPKGPPR